MNVAQFFTHWRIVDNPFKGEEARHDAVFARIGLGLPATGASAHSDFEKILGELDRPSSAIVFGEKGSGKTALRMQIADRIVAHNEHHPDRRVALIAYDDLNAALDGFFERSGLKDPSDALSRVRLVDHLDAVICQGATDLTDHVLSDHGSRRDARRLTRQARLDLALLQALYDRAEQAAERARRLRRVLGVRRGARAALWTTLALLGWLLPGAAIGLYLYEHGLSLDAFGLLWRIVAGLGALVWIVGLVKLFIVDRLGTRRVAHRLRRQLRMVPRSESSLADAVGALPASARAADVLPTTSSDETRYTMLHRLRTVLAGLGYVGVIVVMDRVDEPTLINGDAERMKSLVWPMLNNKFLQQEGVGFKLLLPIELRHALFKESSAFFQEARLDKQNLVERLSWTGAMLYDLCEARLRACRETGAEPIGLLDLFAEEVTRRDVVDALDQMHQPRDALKFLYRCVVEHCSNVTHEENEFRVPRLVLEHVRKTEADRVQQLYRGIRPA